MLEQPSGSEYQVLIQHKNELEATLTQLRLHQAFEAEESPEKGRGTNLLDYLVRGQKDARQGVRLCADIKAVEAQLKIVDEFLDDWQERTDAYQEEQLKDNPANLDDPVKRL